MELMFLGTGGAVSGPRRGNTSLLVASEGTALVDCSGNPVRTLTRLGVPWKAVDGVLLTHRHPDHVYGLPSLVHQMHVATVVTGRPRGSLAIWGPETALEAARGLLVAAGLWEREDMFEIELEPLELEVSSFRIGDLEVTAFPVTHGEVETVGYKLAPEGRPGAAVVYSADTAPCGTVVRMSRGASVLVHECSSVGEEEVPGHTNVNQLPALLEGTDVPRVFLVHLPPMTAAGETTLQGILESHFGDRVSLAEDLMRMKL